MPFSAPCPNDRYIAAKWEKLQLRRCVCLITVFAQNCSRERVNNRRTPRVSGFGDWFFSWRGDDGCGASRISDASDFQRTSIATRHYVTMQIRPTTAVTRCLAYRSPSPEQVIVTLSASAECLLSVNFFSLSVCFPVFFSFSFFLSVGNTFLAVKYLKAAAAFFRRHLHATPTTHPPPRVPVTVPYFNHRRTTIAAATLAPAFSLCSYLLCLLSHPDLQWRFFSCWKRSQCRVCYRSQTGRRKLPVLIECALFKLPHPQRTSNERGCYGSITTVFSQVRSIRAVVVRLALVQLLFVSLMHACVPSISSPYPPLRCLTRVDSRSSFHSRVKTVKFKTRACTFFNRRLLLRTRRLKRPSQDLQIRSRDTR